MREAEKKMSNPKLVEKNNEFGYGKRQLFRKRMNTVTSAYLRNGNSNTTLK